MNSSSARWFPVLTSILAVDVACINLSVQKDSAAPFIGAP